MLLWCQSEISTEENTFSDEHHEGRDGEEHEQLNADIVVVVVVDEYLDELINKLVEIVEY